MAVAELRAFGRKAEPEAAPPRQVTTGFSSFAAEKRHDALTRLREKVMTEIDPAVAAELTARRLRTEVEAVVHDTANRERIEISAADQAVLAEEITNDMVGFGPLESLLADDAITDIMVNGPHEVYIEVRGRLQKANIAFRDARHAAHVAQKIAAGVGRRVDEASPLLDARLPDGSRVNVVFPQVALD
ncbi:MAG: ATPase, T2SS/T4P/T4SS family, partial [Solirubrobacteraceae bacterium]